MRRHGKLTREDRLLWARVAKTIDPLRAADALDDLVLDAEERAKDAEPVVRKAARAFTAAAQQPRAAEGRPASLIDRPTRRKLEKGRVDIDGRIDLHGMSQAEAHGALLSFLRRAQERGHRHVLVITGKGSSPRSEGVLARSVPTWFATMPFRGLVSGYEQAARRHGGEGALYVRVKRSAFDHGRERP